MKNDPLKQYARLRQQLFEEKHRLEARLDEITQVMASEMAVEPSLLDQTPEPPPQQVSRGRRRGRRKNQVPLRELVAQALSKGPLSRKELAKAVEDLGYVSHAKDPLASMGVFLYSKKSPFKRKDGKFYLPKEGMPQSGSSNGSGGKKRVMSPEAKARISVAQKARWAARKAGK